jgi:hypothetical protein
MSSLLYYKYFRISGKYSVIFGGKLISKKYNHAFDGLCGQDPVVGSGDGFDGLNDEGDSDYFDCWVGGAPPPPPLTGGISSKK